MSPARRPLNPVAPRIRGCLVLLALLAVLQHLPQPVRAGTVELDLYSGTAPGSDAHAAPETVSRDATGSQVYSNVSKPHLTGYLPVPDKANGTAVLYLPGGGLRALYVGKEAEETVNRLQSLGVAVFVLRYRTMPVSSTEAPGFPPPPPKLEIRNANTNPAPNDAALSRALQLAIADCQTALHLTRQRAAEWHVNSSKVGLIGASAGGGVAIGTLIADRQPDTPDFVATLYGPSLQDVTLPPRIPPLFIATETNHSPVTDGLMALFQVWHGAHAPVELHSFDVLALNKRPDLWLSRFIEWLGEHEFLPRT